MYKKTLLACSGSRLLYFLLMGCCAAIVSSCATLPAGVVVPESEEVKVKHEFSNLAAFQQGCLAQIDADVSVTFEKLLQKGTIRGYLQALPPGYLRFDGVNPLGLTEIILAIENRSFTFLNVRELKSYSGSVEAKKFKKYAPEAFSDDFIYLLSGLVPIGESFQVRRVLADEDGQGYWLDVSDNQKEKQMTIRFQPQKQQVDRIIIRPEKGKKSVVISYQYPLNSTSQCPEPALIEVDTNGNGLMAVDFTKRYPFPKLKKEHFQVAVPANYNRIFVQ